MNSHCRFQSVITEGAWKLSGWGIVIWRWRNSMRWNRPGYSYSFCYNRNHCCHFRSGNRTVTTVAWWRGYWLLHARVLKGEKYLYKLTLSELEKVSINRRKKRYNNFSCLKFTPKFDEELIKLLYMVDEPCVLKWIRFMTYTHWCTVVAKQAVQFKYNLGKFFVVYI